MRRSLRTFVESEADMTDFQVWAFYWVAAIVQLFMAGGILWLARRRRPKILLDEFDAVGDWPHPASPAVRDDDLDSLLG
jgi:hypothetical protein